MAIIKGSPKSISLEEALMIQEQLKKCICKIKFKETIGSGFFCFIPYNNKCLPVLVTASYVLYLEDKSDYVSIELNDTIKTIQLKDGRKTYSNKEFEITIIEIIPEKDFIYNFLQLDNNIFIPNSNIVYEDQSSYILHHDSKNKIISFGMMKNNLHKYNIYHSCNTGNFSGGAPILNLSSGKTIGVHIGSKLNFNYNIGNFLNFPITQFININKDYINISGLSPDKYSIENCIYTIIHMNLNLDDSNLKLELIQEKEKTKQLEEKIKELNKELDERIAKANSILSNNYQVIEKLKAKLSRFPFELSEGEKIMSIIITPPDKKFIRSIICKNNDIFYDLEKIIYQKNESFLDIRNYFTLNGRKIDETKSLEKNQIKDNDIIIINK